MESQRLVIEDASELGCDFRRLAVGRVGESPHVAGHQVQRMNQVERPNRLQYRKWNLRMRTQWEAANITTGNDLSFYGGQQTKFARIWSHNKKLEEGVKNRPHPRC